MFLIKAIRSHHFHSLHLKTPLLSTHSISSNFNQSSNLSSILQRPFSLSAQEFENSEEFEEKSKKTKKPLDVLFKEAVGIVKTPENDITESGSDNESENGVLKTRLRKIEEEVRAIKEQRKIEKLKLKEKGEKCADDNVNKSKSRTLHAIFAKNEKSREVDVLNEASDDEKPREVDVLRMEKPGVYKELSSDMIAFVTHLYTEGYFKDSNFLPRNKFDISCFENSYARDFIKCAAEQFGKDNQEIAKWLSGSDLKTVALFGCPSLAKKSVFSAKRLRTFFRIQENIVCDKCVVRDSCKFVNQSVWKGDTKTLNLAVVMRVITLYAMESVPSQLVLPEKLKASVSKLMKEVVKLSQTVP